MVLKWDLKKKNQIIEWYNEKYDYELDNSFWNRVTFYDKGYGFFRDWMDTGADETILKKAIKYMISKRIYDSREIEDEEWMEILNIKDNTLPKFLEYEMISIPDIPMNTLKKFSGSYLVGGGRYECLAEVKILMDTLNIRYTMVRKWIYGG